ncbi:MAG: MBL fold metallo-hydrolase [Deltaproteobacteria bacterium]|nr:MBL fold metallo-hydrolase [Deltaproteobacteria bacterium]
MNPFTGRLTFLGTGTGVPSKDRASPACLLELPAARLLIDLGPGSLRQLARVSLAVTDIDGLLLTHLHPDHSADLAPLLFAGKYPPSMASGKILHLAAGEGFRVFYEKLKDLYGSWIEWPPGRLQLHLRPQDRLFEQEFLSLHLASRPVAHTKVSLGFRLTLPSGKTLVFSGDTDYCTSLVELADRADWFVCECSFPEGRKMEGHLTPSGAGRIAREAGVGTLILTHFYPECAGQDLLGPCSREFDGPLVLAEDLMTILL